MEAGSMTCCVTPSKLKEVGSQLSLFACLGKFRQPGDGLLSYQEFSSRKFCETLMQDAYFLAMGCV